MAKIEINYDCINAPAKEEVKKRTTYKTSALAFNSRYLADNDRALEILKARKTYNIRRIYYWWRVYWSRGDDVHREVYAPLTHVLYWCSGRSGPKCECSMESGLCLFSRSAQTHQQITGPRLPHDLHMHLTSKMHSAQLMQSVKVRVWNHATSNQTHVSSEKSGCVMFNGHQSAERPHRCWWIVVDQNPYIVLYKVSFKYNEPRRFGECGACCAQCLWKLIKA